MSTHSILGVKFSDDKIIGCYVHYDGSTMKPRIEDFIKRYTTTGLSVIITKAQSTGGMRSFHSPDWDSEDSEPDTDFLDDWKSHVIDEKNWGNLRSHGVYYSYLVCYDTGEINATQREN